MPETSHREVLVVEDDLVARRVLVRQLRSNGFDARIAESGEEALASVDSGPPDLIVLDIGLPGIDGFETLRRLRARRETARVPVVILTARDDVQDWVRGYSSGASYYLSKPYFEKQLLRGLETALSGAAC